jgi:hypothetical protein
MTLLDAARMVLGTPKKNTGGSPINTTPECSAISSPESFTIDHAVMTTGGGEMGW